MITFTGADDGITWESGSNWDGGIVPGSTDDVTIPDGFNVVITSAAACNTLTVAGYSSLYLNNDLACTDTAAFSGNSGLAGIGGTLSVANRCVFSGNSTNSGIVNLASFVDYAVNNGNCDNTEYHDSSTDTITASSGAVTPFAPHPRSISGSFTSIAFIGYSSSWSDGGADGQWSTAANWTPNWTIGSESPIPDADISVVIDGAFTVDGFGGSYNIGSLSLANGATLFHGTWIIAPGGVVSIDASGGTLGVFGFVADTIIDVGSGGGHVYLNGNNYGTIQAYVADTGATVNGGRNSGVITLSNAIEFSNGGDNQGYCQSGTDIIFNDPPNAYFGELVGDVHIAYNFDYYFTLTSGQHWYLQSGGVLNCADNGGLDPIRAFLFQSGSFNDGSVDVSSFPGSYGNGGWVEFQSGSVNNGFAAGNAADLPADSVRFYQGASNPGTISTPCTLYGGAANTFIFSGSSVCGTFSGGLTFDGATDVWGFRFTDSASMTGNPSYQPVRSEFLDDSTCTATPDAAWIATIYYPHIHSLGGNASKVYVGYYSHWTGASSSDWSDSGNWTGYGVPGGSGTEDVGARIVGSEYTGIGGNHPYLTADLTISGIVWLSDGASLNGGGVLFTALGFGVQDATIGANLSINSIDSSHFYGNSSCSAPFLTGGAGVQVNNGASLHNTALSLAGTLQVEGDSQLVGVTGICGGLSVENSSLDADCNLVAAAGATLTGHTGNYGALAASNFTLDNSTNNGGTLTGIVTYLNGGANNTGTIDGDAQFNSSSWASVGHVTGNARFAQASDGNLTITSGQTFGTVDGYIQDIPGDTVYHLLFVSGSANAGIIGSGLTTLTILGFSGNSHNYGTINLSSGELSFNDYAENNGVISLGGDLTSLAFADYALNYGTIYTHGYMEVALTNPGGNPGTIHGDIRLPGSDPAITVTYGAWGTVIGDVRNDSGYPTSLVIGTALQASIIPISITSITLTGTAAIQTVPLTYNGGITLYDSATNLTTVTFSETGLQTINLRDNATNAGTIVGGTTNVYAPSNNPIGGDVSGTTVHYFGYDQVCTWTGLGDGVTWTDPANWSPAFPGTIDTALLPTGSYVSAGYPAAAVANLMMQGDSSLLLLSPLTVTGTLTMSDSAQLASIPGDGLYTSITVGTALMYNLANIAVGSSITGPVTMNDQASNAGTIYGDVILNFTSDQIARMVGNMVWGTVTGDVGDANHNSINSWLFLDNSQNLAITGPAVYKGNSVNHGLSFTARYDFRPAINTLLQQSMDVKLPFADVLGSGLFS